MCVCVCVCVYVCVCVCVCVRLCASIDTNDICEISNYSVHGPGTKNMTDENNKNHIRKTVRKTEEK